MMWFYLFPHKAKKKNPFGSEGCFLFTAPPTFSMDILLIYEKLRLSWESRNVPDFRTVTYLVSTMDTASLRMLSPNTSMFRTGSTFSALKMAMVATGSTAEIREPNAKLQREREREKHLKREYITATNRMKMMAFYDTREGLRVGVSLIPVPVWK